jgi:hypothetical protein
LIDVLKFENTMLFNTIDTLKNKLKEYEDLLKKIYSDNLKGMLCIHTNISNKSDLIIDNLSDSTSHAFDFKLDSIVIKHVIVNTACLDNSKKSCLTDGVKPKSKKSVTQGKFVPTFHYCGKIGHIRPNCYMLKSHKPWNKQVAPKNDNSVKPSSDKYVSPIGDSYLKKVRTLFCKNGNLKIAEPVKKHFSKRS